jgi:hypothetical protein
VPATDELKGARKEGKKKGTAAYGIKLSGI